MLTLSAFEHLRDKRLLIRVDFNVPMDEHQHIIHDGRLKASLPTIQWALSRGAKIILLSHLGRPNEGYYQKKLSLRPIADRLSELLQHPVRFVNFAQDWLTQEIQVNSGEIILCENIRFNNGEKANDDKLAKKLATLCDIFVMDAFATAHRAEASTCGVAKFAPIACAGFLLSQEITALSTVLTNPARPLIAIVGGSKVSTKLQILERLLEKVDSLIVGGGIANTFLAAQNVPIGLSLHEPALIDSAKKLITLSQEHQVNLYLPKDVVLTKTMASNTSCRMADIHEILPDEIIADIGPQTRLLYDNLILSAGTILWNGPVGVFEYSAFSKGTQAISQAIAKSKAFSVAGGGDTLSAIDQFGIADYLSYISTGGGAFLEFIEGKKLPGIEALDRHV